MNAQHANATVTKPLDHEMPLLSMRMFADALPRANS